MNRFNLYQWLLFFLLQKNQINNPMKLNQDKAERPILTDQPQLDPLKYSVFRLDGHGFSRFVKQFKMKLPFDENFTQAMRNTAIECFNYYQFVVGFVGSDEISYVLPPMSQEQLAKGGTLEFSGRVEKMVSLLAGKVSVAFFMELTKLEGIEKTKDFSPHFDCRVFQVATLQQSLQNLSDRVVYTLKNSRMMLAQHHFSQKQLNGVPSKEAVEMLLKEKGIDYNEVVAIENRIGSVLVHERVAESKVVSVKGQQKEINYERRRPKIVNLGPTEVKQLTEKDLFV